MPSVDLTRRVEATPSQVWDFVQDIDNWAPVVLGYQSHEKIDQRHSRWTLKGDVGILSRTVTFQVEITEWILAQRVAFSLSGVEELVSGEGVFVVREAQTIGHSGAAATDCPGLLRRLVARLLRLLAPHRLLVEPVPVSFSASAADLDFHLSLNAGGMIGPVVNAMLEPLMGTAAAGLAESIGRAAAAPRSAVESSQVQAPDPGGAPWKEF